MRTATVLVLALALIAGACGDSETASTTTIESADVPRYHQPGPHEVEQEQLALEERSQDTGTLMLWYPAPGDDRAATFPLVVFANGVALAPADYSGLMSHLASWGFVVVAPERARDVDLVEVAGDLRSAVTTGEAADVPVAQDGPVVLAGHSAGTTTAGLTAAGPHADEVAGSVFLAGGGAAASGMPPASPTLFLAGGRDPFTDQWVRPGLEAADAPARMVLLDEAGHESFSDVCAEGETRLQPSDCAADQTVEAGVGLTIRHSLVAFVRWRLGLDETPRSLDAPVLSAVADAEVTVEE